MSLTCSALEINSNDENLPLGVYFSEYVRWRSTKVQDEFGSSTSFWDEKRRSEYGYMFFFSTDTLLNSITIGKC